MGKLMDFLGGFGGSLGNQLQEKRRMDYATAAEELQRKRMREDAATTYNLKTELEPPVPTPYGQPVQRGPGNWVQPTRIARPGRLAASGTAVESPGTWEDGPDVPAQDPNALTPYQKAQIDQKELDRQNKLDVAGVRSSGKGGRGAGRPPSPVTVTNPDGSKTQYDPVSGDVLHDFPAKRGRSAGKDATERKAIKETLDSIAGAESVIEVKNALRAHGINPDSQEVLNLQPDNNGQFLPALKAYAAEKIGAKVKEPEASDTKSQSPDRIIAAAKAAIAEGRDEKAVRRKTAQLLGIDEKDVQL